MSKLRQRDCRNQSARIHSQPRRLPTIKFPRHSQQRPKRSVATPRRRSSAYASRPRTYQDRTEQQTYELFTLPRIKTYRLVANKRIFPPEDHPDPFLTYHYDYNQIDHELSDILLLKSKTRTFFVVKNLLLLPCCKIYFIILK